MLKITTTDKRSWRLTIEAEIVIPGNNCHFRSTPTQAANLVAFETAIDRHNVNVTLLVVNASTLQKSKTKCELKTQLQ